MNPNLKYRIAFSRITANNPRIAKILFERSPNLKEFFNKEINFSTIPGLTERGIKRLKKINYEKFLALAEKEIEFIKAHNISPLFITDKEYPHRLSMCEDAPLLLYLLGKNRLNSTKIISIVGTRKPTTSGRDFCEKLVAEIAKRHKDAVVVSGLAYGVDIGAHRAAIKNGVATYGIMAHGLDRIYPSAHTNTAKEMLGMGGLLTEFMSGTNSDKQNFVKRNRIIAGLADVTIVVESAEKGGALITAGIAQSYNRDVMAMPGRVNDKYSRGCNHLIKSNIAAMIESVEDIEYITGWEPDDCQKEHQRSLFDTFESKEEELISTLLKKSEDREMNINTIARSCNMPVNKVSATLLNMELKGAVKAGTGGFFRLL
ncbi:DNA-processing protein DprA [Marinilabiliaceae bacterium ANBcel2]|nr:DNA-processing protein DprA [Marinilabiliaceae bacterium ANBcel2]